uniref:VOC domain-containing protein n=1 Tax=Kalanchoe fedtschenkoi TaxID=63787 RepID=A0A7N0RG74_KALFE
MGKEIESVGDEMQKWLSPDDDDQSLSLSSSKMPLLSLNHVSFVCSSLEKSIRFYADVLGFVMIKRPSSFDFEGAWLFSNGIGIHLLESEKARKPKKTKINPKDNHISFQCTDMELIKKKLKQNGLEYVTAVVEEGGIKVDQLFFHDPDGYMVEICNCHVLPVLPLAAACPLKTTTRNPAPTPAPKQSFYGSWKYCGWVETQMMENLAVDMMDISF